MITPTTYVRVAAFAAGLAVACGAVTLSSGCIVGAEVEATAPAPHRLVWVGPGLWVVESWDEPVFYFDDLYWTIRGGYWYRSDYYTDGWVRARVVPPRITRIRRPRRYVRYRAPARAKVRRIERRSPSRVRRNRAPTHRDNRQRRTHDRPTRHRRR